MKYFLLLIFTLTVGHSFGQAKSLKKYSYLLTGDTILPFGGHGHVQGTGFFLKKDKGIFLICAKHTLAGCDNQNLIDERYPTTIKLWMPNKKDSIILHTKTIKDTTKCESWIIDPDIIEYPISNKDFKKQQLNYINDHVKNMPNKSTELVLWGFPQNKSDTSSTLFISHKYTVDSSMTTILKNGLTTDQVNYYITIQDEEVTDTGFIGFSGCPVFLKNETGKYVFIGIQCAANSRENAFYVVKPKYLFVNR